MFDFNYDVTDVLISSLFFFCTDSYENPYFGNFKRKFQIILFVQKSFKCVTVQLDTHPCIAYFLYIYIVATFSIVNAYVVGSHSQFKLILELRSFFLVCQCTLLYSEQHYL